MFMTSSPARLLRGIANRPRIAWVSALTLAAQALVAVVLIASPPAHAAGTTTGDGVSYTLEGCRNNGGITLPNGSGRFLCPDAAYTTGNLGKGWNELDLVPVRVTVQAGNSAPATQNFAFAIAVDNCSGSDGATGCSAAGDHPGYDVLASDAADGTPVYNAARSSGTCGSLTASGELYQAPGVGGTGTTLYRTLSVTGQAKNSTCVYDAYARLALGSHLFPGSSLHFNLTNTASPLGTAGIGAKDVSIPVKEILPQSISKSMSASQGSDSVWNVVKEGPARVDLGDSCAANFTTGSANITVTWTKSAGSAGKITITTTVYATNPASRSINVAIGDDVFLNGTGSGSPAYHLSGSGTVSANATVALINDTRDVDPPASGDGMVSDYATATYTDAVTGIPVPGTTTTNASATISSGAASNDTATITDDEYWSTPGSGISFSVATPSVGSFTNYTAGTSVSGSTHVLWSSGVVSGSGSVTFNKTITGATANVASATLSDTATATTSGNVVTNSNVLGIPVSSGATTSLGVSKSTALQIASSQTFTFHLFDATTTPATDLSKSVTVTIPALGNGPVDSTLATGLSPDGTYYFHEDAQAPYAAQDTNTAGFSLVAGDVSSCTNRIAVTNNATPPRARVQKITNPASSGLWTFTLTGPNGLSETLTNVQAGAGYSLFAASLEVDGGVYTITETQQTDYDLTSVVGDVAGVAGRVTTSTSSRTCSFTLNLTTDNDQLFSCTFTNTKRGHVRVVKTVSGQAPTGSQQFTFQLRSGASASSAGTILETLTATAGNGGVLNFSTSLVPGTTYQMCEQMMPGWLTSLGPPLYSVYNPSGDNSVVCTDFTVTAGQLLVFNIDNRQPPGGMALTIGFWKNWASCAQSNGKQKAVLDAALLAAANAGAPITLGQLVLNPLTLGASVACKDAVNILNKTTIDGKTKKASDPLFNMAAQLLAADLNVAAGAGTCADAVSAITQAHTLLNKYGFTGLGYSPKLTPADATLANSLAATLDKYNNNKLC